MHQLKTTHTFLKTTHAILSLMDYCGFSETYFRIFYKKYRYLENLVD